MRQGLRRDGQDLAANAGVAEVAGAIAGSSITKTHQIACASLIIGRNVPGSTNHSLWLILIPETLARFFTENAEVNLILLTSN